MITLLHIIIAISSIVVSSLVFIKPSQRLLQINYSLIGATFASGFYLVYIMPTHMIQACMSGVTYLAIVAILTVVARRKVAILLQEL
jgi:hypothetical protein